MKETRDRTQYPSYAFTRDELRALAVQGALLEVKRMELRLARMHREFPEAFATATPPIFAAPEAKARPVILPTVETPKKNAKMVASWTPARRAAQAKRMAKHRKTILRGATKKRKAAARPTKGNPMWVRMATYLGTREDHRATSKEITAACDLKHDSAISDAVNRHGEFFRRVSPGVFELTAAGVKSATSANGAHP